MLAKRIHETVSTNTKSFYASIIFPFIGLALSVGLLVIGVLRRDKSYVSRGLTLAGIAGLFAVINFGARQLGSTEARIAASLGGLIAVFLIGGYVLKQAGLYEDTKESIRLFGSGSKNKGKKWKADPDSRDDLPEPLQPRQRKPEFRRDGQQETEVVEPAPEGEVRCSFCGETNDELATFCSECTERL